MPPPPPTPPASSEMERIYYTVRSPWEWVMKNVAAASPNDMIYVESPEKLPSGVLKAQVTVAATPNTQRRRSTMKKGPTPCTLRLEVCSTQDDKLLYALHGTSAALDGLEDKDELVRTIQRCRCEHLNIGPPSVLLKWDITRDELGNFLPSLPVLPGNDGFEMAVLKEPMGSRGEGIYFVSSAEEAYTHIERHRIAALEEPNLLDNIMFQKGRMPAWVMQAEVYPPMLICGGRKFHIRSNLAVLEKLFHDDLLDMYIHNRHEVRIAGAPVEESSSLERNPLQHITNGAGSDTTERVLLSNTPELQPLQGELEIFVAKAFTSLLPDILRRVGYSASQEMQPSVAEIRKFAIAGVDIMVTSEGRFYLLEVNVNPAAPPEAVTEPPFKEHLTGWMTDLVNLTLGKPSPNFLNISDIVNRNK